VTLHEKIPHFAVSTSVPDEATSEHPWAERVALLDPEERTFDEEPLGRRRRSRAKDPVATGPITDDTIVDQFCGLIRQEVFLRLAREGRFPVGVVGKRRLARWGDVVAAAFASRPSVRQAVKAGVIDGVDEIRIRAGLKPKGGV
jgi:hypothetical protein